jgi:hypothetical protein
MAIIHYDDLVRVIMEHPDYETRWKLGVEASEALAINFGTATRSVRSEGISLVTGLIVSLDYNERNVLVSMEFY